MTSEPFCIAILQLVNTHWNGEVAQLSQSQLPTFCGYPRYISVKFGLPKDFPGVIRQKVGKLEFSAVPACTDTYQHLWINISLLPRITSTIVTRIIIS